MIFRSGLRAGGNASCAELEAMSRPWFALPATRVSAGAKNHPPGQVNQVLCARTAFAKIEHLGQPVAVAVDGAAE
jgi:hypothetical protein